MCKYCDTCSLQLTSNWNLWWSTWTKCLPFNSYYSSVYCFFLQNNIFFIRPDSIWTEVNLEIMFKLLFAMWLTSKSKGGLCVPTKLANVSTEHKARLNETKTSNCRVELDCVNCQAALWLYNERQNNKATSCIRYIHHSTVDTWSSCGSVRPQLQCISFR